MKAPMSSTLNCLAAALCATLLTPAVAQKAGGVLRVYERDSPPSASIHEEGTSSTLVPFMPLFNNLVLFDQHAKRNEPGNIRGDLAQQWAWSADATVLTFKLTPGVKWHDGKPLTSADVKCTWDTLAGKRDAGWRKSPRSGWYSNLEEVTINGDLEVAFKLKRPQPSFLSFLASGLSPVYPCHVDGRTMRTAPIGTGPFKLAEFRSGEVIRLTRNPDYFKKGKPLLDGIEYRIIPNQATRLMSFIAGDLDMTWSDVNAEMEKDVRRQQPKAICEMTVKPTGGLVLANSKNEALKDPRFRRALALAIDRKSIDAITAQGKGAATGIMMAPPDGAWGLTAAQLADVAGYGKDVAKNREAARKLMSELGYSAAKPLQLKMMVVNRPNQTVPTVLLIDQLRSINIAASMDAVDIGVWSQRLTRRADFELSYESHAPALDDPDVVLYQGYKCGASANYGDYCSKETDALIDEQSATTDPVKRRKLVQTIDHKLQSEGVRPVFHVTYSGYCRYPAVKGIDHPTNSIYNSYRYEDAWLDH